MMKMNKKVMITLSSVAIASVLGLGIYQSNAAQAQPKLSEAEIRELVESQYPGTITEVDIDKGFNKVVYEVEVESDGKEYEIELDGNTGEVLKLEEKETRGTKQNSTDLAINEKANTENKPKDDNADDKNASDKNTEKPASTKKVAISKEEAEKIALAEFNGTIKELDLDEDDGRLLYEIEIKSPNGEAEIDIDAYTGEILTISIDSEINQPVDNGNNTTEKPATNNPVNNSDDDHDDGDDGDDNDDDDSDDDGDDD